MPFLEEDRTILFHVPHPSGIERKLGLSILRIGKGKARPLYWRSMTKKDTYTLKFVVEGSGGIQTRSGQLSFSKGDVVFFRKGQTYTWWTHPQICSAITGSISTARKLKFCLRPSRKTRSCCATTRCPSVRSTASSS